MSTITINGTSYYHEPDPKFLVPREERSELREILAELFAHGLNEYDIWMNVQTGWMKIEGKTVRFDYPVFQPTHIHLFAVIQDLLNEVENLRQEKDRDLRNHR